MVQKIKAAVDTRVDAEFMILARTDARAVEGFDSALDRVAAYKEAGADLLFVEAPHTVQELRCIAGEVPGTHFCNVVFGGKTPMLPRHELAAMGFAGILYANAAMQAAMLAMKHLHITGSLTGAKDTIRSFNERQVFVNYQQWPSTEKRYSVP